MGEGDRPINNKRYILRWIQAIIFLGRPYDMVVKASLELFMNRIQQSLELCFLIFFSCLFPCFASLFFILCILWFCIVLWIVSPFVYNCLSPIFVQVYRPLQGRDSSVGIATHYGLDGPGIESRWGGGESDFPHPSRPALGPTQPPVQWVSDISRG